MNAIPIESPPQIIERKRADDQLDNLDMHCCIRNLLALGFDLGKNSPSEFHHAYYQLRHELISKGLKRSWKEDPENTAVKMRRERALDNL
jgi:hypothetical protein